MRVKTGRSLTRRKRAEVVATAGMTEKKLRETQ